MDHRERGQADRSTAIAANPGLELVGCYAWSPDKVGRDVGELCGIEPLGVTATERRRRAARAAPGLRRLQPDVAVDRRAGADPRSRCRTSSRPRRSSTAAGSAPDRKRLVDACERGGSSLFGTGISPGFAELLGIVLAGICNRDRQDHDQRGGAHGALRLARHREAGRLRPADRRSGPPDDDRRGHGGVRRGRGDGGRRARRRARRDRLRGRAREDDRRTSTSARGQIAAGLRGRRRGELAGPGRRPHGRRAERALEEGADRSSPTGRSRTATSSRCRDFRRCARTLQFLPPPDFQVKTLADFMVHRPHHDGDARGQRDPGASWPRRRAS